MIIFVQSPTGTATGGTELLQQFCHTARKAGFDCRMLYTDTYEGSPVQKKFDFYGNPSADRLEDEINNAIIVPEVHVHTLSRVESAHKAIWWESVDNYRGAIRHRTPRAPKQVKQYLGSFYYVITHPADRRTIKSCVNFVQSEYARQYLIHEVGVTSSRILELSDYVDERYRTSSTSAVQRDNLVLYNPKKGAETTSRLMKFAPDIEWIPLAGYSLDEMIDLFHRAKVYIDFGNHPGKDRMPREAASAGCCIVTGSRGSASNNRDVPIPAKYKLANNSTPEQCCKIIRDCLNNFDACSEDFSSYRDTISIEREKFEREVVRACETLTALAEDGQSRG